MCRDVSPAVNSHDLQRAFSALSRSLFMINKVKPNTDSVSDLNHWEITTKQQLDSGEQLPSSHLSSAEFRQDQKGRAGILNCTDKKNRNYFQLTDVKLSQLRIIALTIFGQSEKSVLVDSFGRICDRTCK